MKTAKIILAIASSFILLSFISIQDSSQQEPQYNKIVKLKITGMTCGGCAKTISKALDKKDGIVSTDIEYPGDKTSVTYNPKVITLEEIHACIKKAGYRSTVIK